MKIYIATLFRKNYGSALQAYALQHKLEEYGVRSVIVEHKPVKRTGGNKLCLILSLLKPEKHYGPIRKIRRLLDSKKYAVKNRKINRFVAENIRFQPYAACREEIEHGSCVLLSGSDQVWSIINHPISGHYLFDYAPKGKGVHKVSYAASIGLSKLTEEQKAYYRRVLQDYQWVSFREQEAYDLLCGHLKNEMVRCDPDPTLLYDGQFWSRLVQDRIVQNKYVFVYMLRPDKRLIKMARRVAAQKGLKIIFTGQFADRYLGVETVVDAGVEDFLSYIYHADAVITNSFHCTVFSVLFGRPFASVKVESTSSRARNFLRMTGMEEHLIDSVEQADVVWQKADYAQAYCVLDKKRDAACTYIRRIAELANETADGQ